MALHTHKTWVEIDSAALLANLGIFRATLGSDTALLLVVKANAYGHGLYEVASLIAQSKEGKSVLFGVDSMEEAMALKSRGIKNHIVILGYIPARLLSQALYNKFHISVFNKETLAAINHILGTAHAHPAPRLHLKIETGLNRLGFSPGDLEQVRLPALEGMYTHFADVEDAESHFYKTQLARFEEARTILVARGIIPRYIHAASTAAVMQYPETHFNLARVGIGLYGLSPLIGPENSLAPLRTKSGLNSATARPHLEFSFPTSGLTPVLSWKTRIAHIATVKKGESVGYDRAFVSDKDRRISVLPVGYSDGFDRELSGKGRVLINGVFAPVVGRVCMNMTMVDTSEVVLAVGDEVVLIGKSHGKEVSASDVAQSFDTIHYEVVSRINPLIPRVII